MATLLMRNLRHWCMTCWAKRYQLHVEKLLAGAPVVDSISLWLLVCLFVFGPSQTHMQVNTILEMRTFVKRIAIDGQTDSQVDASLTQVGKKAILVQP